MFHYTVKVIITALLVVAISELAKRNTMGAAVLASLPLMSLLAFVWIYIETGDAGRIANLSQGIFWLALPSLALFLLLPLLVHAGWNFWVGLAASCVATAISYAAMLWLFGKFGVKV